MKNKIKTTISIVLIISLFTILLSGCLEKDIKVTIPTTPQVRTYNITCNEHLESRENVNGRATYYKNIRYNRTMSDKGLGGEFYNVGTDYIYNPEWISTSLYCDYTNPYVPYPP